MNFMEQRAIPETLRVSHLVMKFPYSYGTQMFMAKFTRVCHWILS